MNGYCSVKEISRKFGISTRRVQTLCEQGRIEGAVRMSGVWLIPSDAKKPVDARFSSEVSEQLSLFTDQQSENMTLAEACRILSISIATGNNWIKLGKLVPDHYVDGKPIFSKTKIHNILAEIKSGHDDKLKSRRNKKYVSGNNTYKGYIIDEKGFQVVEKIVDSLKIHSQLGNRMNVIIAEYSLKLLRDAGKICCPATDLLLLSYIEGKCELGIYKPLIDDLIYGIKDLKPLIEEMSAILGYQIQYSTRQDFLGLLYLSLKCIGERKATGSYYTPFSVVSSMVDDFADQKILEEGKMIIDPCCGTGNFLIYLSKYLGDIECIFGQDMDAMSVMITRVNLALAFHVENIDILYKNITVGDSLDGMSREQYDIVIGNPPWGYDFPEQRVAELCKRYESASSKGMESFSLFIENALYHCSPQGSIGFVLPEALLNVKSHRKIRSIIIRESQIKKITYLGNIFNGVHCPAIVLILQKGNSVFSTVGMEIAAQNRRFIIHEKRAVSDESFDFDITDEEYNILKEIEECPHRTYLKGNADFALGIVTGDNKKFILKQKTESSEVILKGSDIYKYRVVPSDNFIVYNPELFQQVAPTEYYRAPEKLLYRFICDRLVFAYDDKQYLSLNSGNILIPRIQGLKMKYILAILNSSLIQFYFSKKFASVKILRSHIEQLPIPVVGPEVQDKIIKKVDCLLLSNEKEEISNLYQEIDMDVFNLFGLNTPRCIEVVMSEIRGKNNFLFA